MKLFLKMQYYLLITIASLWCSIACATTAPQPASSCDEFNELIKIANSQDMLKLSPDAFFAKYKNLISVESDKSDSLTPPLVRRQLVLKALKGLVKADVIYEDADAAGPLKSLLLSARFTIPLTCLPSIKQLDALLSKPQPTTKELGADPNLGIYWEWHNPEPNNADIETYTSFRIYSTEARLEMGRAPTPLDEE